MHTTRYIAAVELITVHCDTPHNNETETKVDRLWGQRKWARTAQCMHTADQQAPQLLPLILLLCTSNNTNHNMVQEI